MDSLVSVYSTDVVFIVPFTAIVRPEIKDPDFTDRLINSIHKIGGVIETNFGGDLSITVSFKRYTTTALKRKQAQIESLIQRTINAEIKRSL